MTRETCNRYERREWLAYPGWNTVRYVPPGETPQPAKRKKHYCKCESYGIPMPLCPKHGHYWDAQHWQEPPRIR